MNLPHLENAMAWDRRGYYYRSFRVGKRVCRRYYGNGPVARRVALDEEIERQQRHEEALRRLEEKRLLEELDALLADHARLCRLAATAAMLAAGYHAPHREWHKKRKGTPMPSSTIATRPTGPLSRTEAEKVLHRFNEGETTLLREVQTLLAGDASRDGLATTFGGDLTYQVARNLLANAFSSETQNHAIAIEAILARFKALRQELAGVRPSPVELLLADRVAVLWLNIHLVEMWIAQIVHKFTIEQADFQSKRVERLHKQMMSATITLARVRRLAVPVLTVQLSGFTPNGAREEPECGACARAQRGRKGRRPRLVSATL
jgi:hypothetical protein